MWCARPIRRSRARVSPSAFSPIASTATPCTRQTTCRPQARRATLPTAFSPMPRRTWRRAICHRSSMSSRSLPPPPPIRPASTMARRNSCRSPMKAGRCCRSFTTSRRAQASLSTPPTTARPILPMALARSRRPAPRSRPTTRITLMSLSIRMASSRRRLMRSPRRALRIFLLRATTGKMPGRAPHRASRRFHPARRTPMSIC